MNDMDMTPYEHLGGEAVLKEMVTNFYGFVKQDEVLAPLFPEDLTETARKQTQFLTQFLGGPSLYTMEHGHPMLRARHMPFPITNRHAKAWLGCMEKAMDSVSLQGPLRDFIISRLTMTAYHMVNTSDDSHGKENNY
ncbi:globin [Fictibacillus enclensis]|uniref:globin domain-containing protein n=1 Tax=Fictibacillus enclensis TaxID=1017270 RepID=UPI0025A04E11|nr:globin [Fictibacillus enclensis]MDM5198634.1 globin [Fictibacillus enclensis]MDM5337837.1 globin [Fictibacillus enclensis]